MPFDPWPWRRRAPLPTPEPMPAPVLDAQLDEFENTPMGGHAGEAFTIPPDPPATTVSGGLVIEPPDWEAEAAAFPSEKEAGPEVDALTAMKMAAGDMDWPEWGPPATTPPLEPVTFPEVDDWRAVEAEQAHLKGRPCPTP